VIPDGPVPPFVRAGDLVFVSGQVGAGADGREALKRLGAVLESAGATPDDVVDVVSFHTDARDVDACLRTAGSFFTPPYPAWTPVGMTGSYEPEIRVAIRAIAHTGRAEKTAVPAPGGEPPLSLGCRKGSLLVVSAPFGANFAAGDPRAQASGAYAQAREALEEAGGSLDDVIDICSFHLDPRTMVPCEQLHNETWAGVPLEEAPAWTAIGAPSLYAPGQLVQYRLIADLSPGSRIAKTPASLHWKHCPISGGTRKEGGRLIGIAGEVASDAEGNITTPGDTLAQARYAFNRISEVVELHGVDMGHVVEVVSFHKDHRAWEIVLEAGSEYFGGDGGGPAWTPVGMTGLWNPGYLHEIYALAVV
jgi:enamine deaminase RidA (YjgF/YER057c/UK114 family)